MNLRRRIKTMQSFLRQRRDTLDFEAIPDPRDRRGQRWSMGALLSTTVLGLMMLAKSLRATEDLSEDLAGAPGMEVINSISELKPGDFLALHFHHGIESGVVLQGGIVEIPGKGQIALPTGAPIMNLRNVPHGGWKVVGDTTIRLFTVHIVDKGKPLYDTPK